MVLGTSSPATASPFHSDEPDQVTEYRSLSVPALLALILGLASPVSFGTPLLMLVPVAGIALAIYALRGIAASDGARAGRWAALTGLFLCAALTVAPFARSYVLRTMRIDQAQEFSERWLRMMVAGDTKNAYRLTLDSTRGTPPPEPGETAPPKSGYDLFLERPLVKSIAAAGTEAAVALVETVGYDGSSFSRAYVSQTFEISPAAQPAAQPVKVTLTVQRARVAREGRSRWLVWSIDDPTKPATQRGGKS